MGLKFSHIPFPEHHSLWKSRSFGNHLHQLVTTVLLNKNLPYHVLLPHFMSEICIWVGESGTSAYEQTSALAWIDPVVLVL